VNSTVKLQTRAIDQLIHAHATASYVVHALTFVSLAIAIASCPAPLISTGVSAAAADTTERPGIADTADRAASFSWEVSSGSQSVDGAECCQVKSSQDHQLDRLVDNHSRRVPGSALLLTLCSTLQSTSLSSHLWRASLEKLVTIVSLTWSSMARMSTVKFTCLRHRDPQDSVY
jgi:hypothetical protein